MGKWSTLLTLGKKGWAVGRKVTDSAPMRSLGGAVIHPQRTLTGVGSSLKTAAVGGAMGYVAWEALVNDKPVVRSVSDALIGEKAVDKTIDTASAISDKISDVTTKAGDALQGVQSASHSVSQTWGGLGNFLGNITGGNGMNMMGNFLGNLTQGNVSGMSILGLLLSGLLVFGRFGWLGKIAGAVMSMMLIGSNAQTLSRAQTPSLNTEQSPQMAQSGGMKR
jgi:hypothetical protein